METTFHISYTLDMLSFIELILKDETDPLHQEEVEKFKPMLGTVSDKYIKKLDKISQHHPNFIRHIITLLISNDELHLLKTSHLLGSHRQLVDKYKKSGYYKSSSDGLKRFIKSDYKKSIIYLRTIATDLERLGFKSFWLEHKLAKLKQRVAFFEDNSVWVKVVKYANQWILAPIIPEAAEWYILAFNTQSFDTLLKRYNLVDLSVKDDFFYHVVTYALMHDNYHKVVKTLKPTSQLKIEFKTHENRKKYGSLSRYVEMCLKIALKAFLLNRLEDEDEQLGIPDDYPFATQIYQYLLTHERQEADTAKHYLLQMIKHLSK